MSPLMKTKKKLELLTLLTCHMLMKIEDWRTNNKVNEINTDANNEYVDNFDP